MFGVCLCSCTTTLWLVWFQIGSVIKIGHIYLRLLLLPSQLPCGICLASCKRLAAIRPDVQAHMLAQVFVLIVPRSKLQEPDSHTNHHSQRTAQHDDDNNRVRNCSPQQAHTLPPASSRPPQPYARHLHPARVPAHPATPSRPLPRALNHLPRRPTYAGFTFAAPRITTVSSRSR